MASLYNGISPYNTNIATQSGSGAFGAVPGAIGLPNSQYDQTAGVVKNLPGLTNGSASDIASELGGQLSPGTLNLLQNRAAAFGVNSGLPGGVPGNTLSTQNLLDNIGTTSENLASKGVSDYNSFLPTVGSQMLAPSLQADIADRNATLKAAPNPTQAASYAQSLFNQYLQKMGGPAGGTGAAKNGKPWWQDGGFGAFSPPQGLSYQANGTGPYIPGGGPV